jgi:5,10-methylenetetrahydromethanopterin reductase
VVAERRAAFERKIIMSIKFSVMFNGAYPMREYIGMAKTVENYGFDEIHVADDLMMRPAWPILTLIGEHTKTIQLGPAIVTPHIAHPVYHASNLVALDELTNGRAVCGVGRGGLNSLLGIPRHEKTKAILREAFQVMRRVIAVETTEFSGEFFSTVRQLQLHHEPLRREIPMFLGTWGPQMARLGGELAGAIKADCVADPTYLAVLRDNLRLGAAQAGRDPDTAEMIVGPLCSISSDPVAARRTMKQLLAVFLPFLSPMKEAIGIDEAAVKAANNAYLAGDLNQAEQLLPDAAVDAFSLTGTVDEVIPRIEGLIDAGATHVAFGPPHGPDFPEAIKLLGEQVLPYFRGSG